MASADLSGLRGQRVLITGAARGIGAALAERLAAQGARLALVGLEPETMAAVAARCGEGTFVAECDVSDSEQVTRAIDAAAEALGGLDVVVANAGIATGGPLRMQDLRSWERVIEINLLGVMYTDRAALPHLERSRGYVLNIASTAAALRGPGMSAYCAAKAGVEALSDCLRIEMQPFGVDVGVAYFLFLDTDMVNDAERESPLMQRAKAEMPSFILTHLPAASGDRRGHGCDCGAPPARVLPTLVPEGPAPAPAAGLQVCRAPDGQDRARRDPRVRKAGSRGGRSCRVGDRAHAPGRRPVRDQRSGDASRCRLAPSTTISTISAGSSLTRIRSRSSGAILPSASNRPWTQSISPCQ